MYPPRLLPGLLLGLGAVRPRTVGALTYTNQFQLWYPQYGWIYERILRENCTAEYDAYRTGIKNDSAIDRLGGGGVYSALTQPVVLCLLDGASEYVKAQMASSQVLLGVAPTVLALLGPGADETAALLLVARRPLLFVLIAAGSPSVYLGRAFEYPAPARLLAEPPTLALRRARPRGARRAAVTLAEYALVVGAVANIGLVSYDVGRRTICAVISDWIFAPLFWACLGIVVHISGAVVQRMRLRRLGPGEAPTGVDVGLGPWLAGLPRRTLRAAAGEFRIAAAQDDVRVDVFPESEAYVCLSWLLSTAIISQILLGTLIFSSTLFMGPLDALTVLVRYILSAMTCRIVLMYELSGIRDAVKRSRETAGAPATEVVMVEPGTMASTGHDPHSYPTEKAHWRRAIEGA